MLYRMAAHEQIPAGMVGGGPGSGIGESHRIAMRFDDRFQLVAGVFSRDSGKSRQVARHLGIAPERVYGSHEDMARAEARRSDGIRCVAIATPHNSHFEIARCFIERNIHVICDKPLALRLDHALELHRLVDATGTVLALTHNYSGYPMVRQAARMVRDGEIGDVRVVQVEHAHGKTLAPQRLWRTDPAVADKANVMFDLGTHAHHLARFVTGLEVSMVSAHLTTMVPGREIYDNAHLHLRFDNGAVGSLWASMVAVGQEHGLRLRVFGETGSLHWRHEDAQHLVLRDRNAAARVLAAGQPNLAPEASRHVRVSAGHAEGFFAAFANLYSEVADAILARERGNPFHSPEFGFPTVRDGVIGVRFVEASKESHAAAGAWTDAGITI